MKRFVTGLLATILLAGTAQMAAAVQYPPGPGGTCPDTLTMFQIQDPTAICHPAAGDTVFGVRGIVTGFDKDFSPYAFWIQVNGSPYSGAQVFTGGTNYFNAVPGTPTGGNVALGDEIVMYGRVTEFNQMTELLDFDNSQSTNDIILRRLSSGNALPAFHIGTTTELNWVPGLSAATAEPWEGTLVKVNGPLTVRRSIGNGIGSRSFLCTHPGAPGDTLCVDGFSLTNVNAPANGTVINFVQGILSQVTINSINSYRILLRDVTDMDVALPPNVTDAYPVEDNLIRVLFDRDVTEASAENVNNYSLGSFGIINSATLLGGAGRIVVLNVTNGLVDGDNESVTVSGVVASSGGLAMTSPQSRSFINGVLTLAAIQQPDAAALAGGPCQDRSRFVTPTGGSGPRLSYRGICVAQLGTVFYLSDPAATAQPRGGLPAFGLPQPLTVGRQYLLAGQVQEFDGIGTTIVDGLTEGVTVVFVQDEGPATVPAPNVQTIPTLTDTTCDVAQNLSNAEDFEGVLVRVMNARVVEEADAGDNFLIATPFQAPNDTMLVSNISNTYTFDADSNDVLNVTGVLTFRNAGFAFRLHPRNNADIVLLGTLGVPGGDLHTLSLSASPNPARTANLRFSLPQAAEVDLAVYDLAGRKLAQLAKGALEAGTHSRSWNGRTTDGRTLGAGMYFYRLRAAGQTRTVMGVLLD